MPSPTLYERSPPSTAASTEDMTGGFTISRADFLAQIERSFDNAAITLSKKYHHVIKTLCFEDAKMDKLTYAVFKGMEADLSKVTVI